MRDDEAKLQELQTRLLLAESEDEKDEVMILLIDFALEQLEHINTMLDEAFSRCAIAACKEDLEYLKKSS